MATQAKFSKEQEAIIAAQNAACNRLPDDAEARRLLIFNWRTAQGKEADAVAKVKEEVGAAAHLKSLTKRHGMEKPALDFIKAVFAIDPLKRARAIRQVFMVADDYSWIIRDLFDEGAFGSAVHDDGQGSVFDQTRTGQSQGGAAAQPRTVAEMAASNGGPVPTPGLDLSTPEARAEVIAKFAAAELAAKGKRGPKGPDYKEMKANAEAAKKAEEAAKAGAGTEIPPAPPEGGNVVSFVQQQREANAAGDQMARGQKPDEKKPETAPEPEKKKRPSRAKAKDDTPPPPPEQEASGETPPPPPGDDDDDGPDFRTAPVGSNTVGDQPSSYGVR
jgi:hypothetical protein